MNCKYCGREVKKISTTNILNLIGRVIGLGFIFSCQACHRDFAQYKFLEGAR